MAASISLSAQQAGFQERAAENIKRKLRELSKLNPLAKAVMVVAALMVIVAAIYTGYHNWQLVNRLINNKALALIPPVLMDGSLLLLTLAFFVWFTDPAQKFLAVAFEVVLFLIVGINTVLNGTYAPGQPLTDDGRLYVGAFMTIAFLLVLAGWILIFHCDPVIKRHEEKAQKTAEAEQLAHDLQIEQMKADVNRQRAEFDHQAKLYDAMHNARMKALDSDDVQQALFAYEKGLAIAEAQRIRGALPLQDAAKKA